jgi:site-specific recombinase XerD
MTFKAQLCAYKWLQLGVGDIDPATVTPEALEAWRDAESERIASSTINARLGAITTFFNWLEAEGVIAEAPTLYVDGLKRRETMPAVLPAAVRRQVAKGTAEKSGRSAFEALRDETILSLLEDTGLRASECAGVLLENLDLASRQVFVHYEVAKCGQERTVIFGFQTAKLMGRYLRARDDHAYAFTPALFLGRRGPATYGIVYACVTKAARRAGVIGVRPHLYRHTFAHDLKAAGAPDEVLMSLAGWTSSEQLRRYGRSQREARALDAYRQLGSVVDRSKMGAREAPARVRRARYGPQ